MSFFLHCGTPVHLGDLGPNYSFFSLYSLQVPFWRYFSLDFSNNECIINSNTSRTKGFFSRFYSFISSLSTFFLLSLLSSFLFPSPHPQESVWREICDIPLVVLVWGIMITDVKGKFNSNYFKIVCFKDNFMNVTMRK